VGLSANPDIVALARTCGAFTEPALDALWANPPSWKLSQQIPRILWELLDGPLLQGSTYQCHTVLVRLPLYQFSILTFTR
jgi:hypothetical protein